MLFVQSDSKVNIDYIREYHPKNCLILSFEDYKLNDHNHLNIFDKYQSTYVGASDRRLNIVILRDAYNLFASLMNSEFMDSKNHSKYVNLFKEYARIHLGIFPKFSDPIICINYNKWSTDNNYRIETAHKIGFYTSGDPCLDVSSMGGGSSFDKLTARTDPKKLLNTLNRWQTYIHNPLYFSLFEDEELKTLSNKIFGNISEKIT
jgi:hypothetical protein